MHETELKFSVHASFLVPDLGDGREVSLEEGPTLDLRATYFDTEDLRLARAGVTLRNRAGERPEPLWTLKLPTQSAGTREEMELTGAPSSVPEEARRLVIAFARGAALIPVARLKTRRRVWTLLRDGGVIAEIDDDEVSILEGRRVVARFREVELESKGLEGKELARYAKLLKEAGAIETEPIPKAIRALGPRATAPPDVPGPISIEPDGPAGVAVRAAIIRAVNRVVSNDPRARLGDAEGIHQMRVGARRLRSDLTTFAPLVNTEWAGALKAELKWIASVLGEVRDLDVLQASVRDRAEDLEDAFPPLFASLSKQHAGATRALREALTTDRYTALLDRLVEACHDPALSEAAATTCTEILPRLAGSAWSALAKRARRLEPGSHDELFHDVRKRAKAARYAAEAVSPALGDDAEDAERYSDAVAKVQDVLGASQDAHVAASAFADLARSRRDDGALNFQLGRLVERTLSEGRSAQQEFFKVWDKVDRKKRTRWMES